MLPCSTPFVIIMLSEKAALFLIPTCTFSLRLFKYEEKQAGAFPCISQCSSFYKSIEEAMLSNALNRSNTLLLTFENLELSYLFAKAISNYMYFYVLKTMESKLHK